MSVHAQLHDIVGIWLFDEDGGQKAIDSSGNGNDGVFLGKATWVDGKFGKAISLNGVNDAIEIKDNDSIDFDGDQITITSWFWWEGAGDGWQTFVAKGICCNNPAENYGYFINSGGRHTHFAVSPNGIRQTFNSQVNAFEIKAWHFVAVTYDGKSVISYIDGQKSAEQATSGKMTPNNNPLRIGHREASSHWWKGYLDEVAIFRAALTEEEINAIMEEGLQKSLSVAPQGKLAITWAKIKRE